MNNILYLNGLSEEINKKVSLYFPELLKNNTSPELIISSGGDGSVIHTFNQMIKMNYNVPILVIAAGTVNFLSSHITTNVKKLIINIINNKQKIYEYNFFPLEIVHNNKKYLAINDVVFGKNINGFHEFLIESNSYPLKNLKFKGMGLSICSEIGSTGFHLNNNGQIFFDDTMMGITSIVSNTNINDIIKAQPIKVKLLKTRSKVNMYIDGSANIIPIKENEKILVKRHETIYKIAFLLPNQLNNKKFDYLNENRKKHLN